MFSENFDICQRINMTLTVLLIFLNENGKIIAVLIKWEVVEKCQNIVTKRISTQLKSTTVNSY